MSTGFKQFNDHYGHLAGDGCLKSIALTLQATVARAGDFAARYGGEEFVILLSNTEPAGAAAVLTEVLANIRNLSIPHQNTKVSRGIVTISAGCATAVPSDSESAEVILARADQRSMKPRPAVAINWFYAGNISTVSTELCQ